MSRLLTVLVPALLLAGCSSDNTDVSSAITPANTTTQLALNGRVQSGGAAVAGVPVTLLEATTAAPRSVGTATTDATGAFSIAVSSATSASIFYVTADLGSGKQLVTIAGSALPSSVTVNELTTVAAGYSFAQFYVGGNIVGNPFPLRLAAGMNDNLVAAQTGASSDVLLKSPNGDESNSLRSTRALANLLTALDSSGGDPRGFFTLTTPPGGTAPSNFGQALSNLCRFPQQNVAPIYALTKASQAYSPDLTAQPDAWTICVKVNDSGDDNHMPAGTGNIVFDSRGYAWITDNVEQGQGTSGMFAIVLQPNGKPSKQSATTPPSPLFGGGLLGGGYGVDVDQQDNVWIGNFGWGGVNPGPTSSGSVSKFTNNGTSLSNPNGIQGSTERVQDIRIDRKNNVWCASFGNDRVVVFPNGDPNSAFFFQEPSKSAPFDIVFGTDGNAWVTNSGGLDPLGQGSVARYQMVGNSLQQLSFNTIGHSNKGMDVDSQGNAWVASGGDSLVYLFNPNGDLIGSFSGGGITGPWGVTIDGDDNAWVANFSTMKPGDNYTNAGLTKLAGPNPATRPPGLNLGDPISPPTGYTLPSAGAQVLLHNGTPLYALSGGPPSFSPLQRMTNVVIDRAGNIWATNNWKPDLNIDVMQSNPGGDGVVIFVGAAKPRDLRR